MTIRYGIRWDGRGKPKPARLVAVGMVLAAVLLLPVSANAAVGSLAERGRVVYGPDFSSERTDRDLWSGRRWSGDSWIDSSGD